MTRAILAGGMALATACAAFGQSAGTALSFEVASIKPSAPIVDGKLMVRMRGDDPGRVDWTNMSIKMMIQQAYEVKDYQISGPDWIASTRFDLVAKLPAGAPRSQVPEMLRTLLAERFKVTIHKETKDLPMYALVVAKNGPKMKESEVAPPPGDGPGPGGPSAYGAPPPAGGRAVQMGDAAGGGVRIGKDGTPQFAPGAARGPMMMMNGRGHLSAKMMNMSSLVDMLARQLDRPVVDQTGLKGNYDFDLDFTPDESQRPLGIPGLPPPPPGGGEGHAPSASETNGVSLFTAVQSQLGLKLDAKKGPVDLIVVDHVEKAPTEN